MLEKNTPEWYKEIHDRANKIKEELAPYGSIRDIEINAKIPQSYLWKYVNGIRPLNAANMLKLENYLKSIGK